MSEEKKTNIRKNLLKLSFVFPDRKLAIEGIDIYCEMLSDLPDEAIIEAIHSCLCECRFFPTIAEIREKSTPYMDKLRMEESIARHERRLIEDKKEDEEKKQSNAMYQAARVKGLIAKKDKGIASREEIELLNRLTFPKEETGKVLFK